MKRFSLAVSLLAAAALNVACAQEQADTEVATTADTAVAVQQERPDTAVTISRVDGQVVVDPDSIGVRRNTMVRWTAADTGAVWVVVFAGNTPMQGGRRVISSGGPGNSDRAPVRIDVQTGQEFKYWVFYPDGEGGYLQLDPKLVIIEDPGTDTTSTQ